MPAKAPTTDKIASKLRDITSELKSQLVERDTEADLLVRSVVGGTNGLLIGEPGTAKSLMVREFMAHIDDAALYEVLFAKDTPSEQVLGPISLTALENDEYKRIVTGKLPEAHLGFGDEIFKANSTVLNALLSIINEGIFHNNGGAVPVPLWSLIGASNELPGADRDDLRAFRDRFPWTVMVKHVRTSSGIEAVINGQIDRNAGNATNATPTKVTRAEIEQIQQASAQIPVPPKVVKSLADLRQKAEAENLTISMRRLGEGVKLMQAAAVLSDRTEVSNEDMKVYEHVLWTDPEDTNTAYELTLDYAGAVAKRASKLRGEFVEQERALTDLQSQMPTDGSVPETEVMGNIGRVSNMLNKLDGRISSAVDDATSDGDDTSELDQLRADVARARESVKSLLGIGS